MFTPDQQKQAAAMKAIEFAKSGMVIGLGTGSTAKFAVEGIGVRLKSGELQNVHGTPTSFATKDLAEQEGIPLLELGEVKHIDVTFDGADQIDVKTGNCLKGGGGAHYWEKRVAEKSKELVIMVDESKVVESLKGHVVPLEVAEARAEAVLSELERMGLPGARREKMSDSGNVVIDTKFHLDVELDKFHELMMAIEGVLDTGIFVGLVTKVVVADDMGGVKVLSCK